MRNLAADPAQASRLAALKERFWETRKYYDDTDEDAWKRGRKKQFAPEDFIIQRKQ